ncbi:farnesol dehydrogenase [Anseongella ginsenosidimutans]|uniref:Farnesol dehydrogenase n=1 Tax=Anseongella ginsenosidimutans TaxID=496056 RepID=A0A4R3KN04_9SPHI|nr:SDR family oxidoreductase [Anseongella ginsenosidimutans]QEC52524.1 SDR family oxidoreductase [Anseongella ginsenosidimutans]TCS85292.1 farnesol dehydrogenase [Anseongella ginsenosidimutans]
MKIFITGATGFIGKHLALKLAAEGHRVHALARPSAATEDLVRAGVQLFKGDLLAPGSIAEAMQDCREVFHLAGFARAWHKDRSTFHRVNVTGTKNVLDAAMQLGVLKVVAASTAGVFPPALNGRPVTETAARRPDLYTEYERTKNEGEELAAKYAARGLPVVIINPTKVFGPGPVDESNSATLMIRNYLRGTWKIIPGNGKGVMDYVYVEDVAEGIRRAMEKGRPGERYILGGENVSYDRFFKTVAGYMESPRRLFKMPVALIMSIAGLDAAKARITGLKPLITPEWVRKIPYNWSKDSAKAKSELGYSARPFDEAVRLTIAWLQQTRQV